jgi:hypothetical protein
MGKKVANCNCYSTQGKGDKNNPQEPVMLADASIQ